ncbi:MAG: hypothetical protein GYB18_08475 [Oceanospirillales bacterium]|nr:hypothetical protein [Oceanospirillales bacterium]
MQDYIGTQMINKGHAKFIAKELRKRGSKAPSSLIFSKDRSLANLLSLACGVGKYALKIEDIISIGNSEFTINEEGVKELCKRSPTRLGKVLTKH